MLATELKIRRNKIRVLMQQKKIDAAIITCNVNLLYTCGQIVSGYLYLSVDGADHLFIKRPNNLMGESIHPIRKVEQIKTFLDQNNIPTPQSVMLEAEELPYTEYMRIAALFPTADIVNGTPLIHEARSIKTPIEIGLFQEAAAAHVRAYQQIPSIYHRGMTDRAFSIEIEHLMRLEGSLGIFRIFGRSMEIFMGSVLTGDNATQPSPYDFALGGQGADPSLPVGFNGSKLKEGQTVMVDIGGNFNGYICDMSRVFSIGKIKEEAYAAHQVCLAVQDKIAALAKPGAICQELYHTAIEMVKKSGFTAYFMGMEQQAKFIGHGIGLEINESPVIAPRITTELQPGMVFALEPKIVLPQIGPVGIENSWVVTNTGVEKLTHCEESILPL
ncbi:MAG: Xaa-Pro peptidase family protein [Bacteroidaceae bacterium]|nr:Xaa-Pro peptidase family protein [Bacteroidaceae bacterium]